jgi:sarcosine oxidase subunit alpha
MNDPALPPAVLTHPDQALSFTFEGRPIPAVQGQSIAAALYAAGVRIFTRSFKYHRPRGLLCVSGDCANCLMQVDGRPNVRSCTEPAAEGQVVAHQNAWPSLDFDALQLFDRLDRFLPVGFYYKRFHRPRWLWPLFEHTVRHIAGLGRVDAQAVPTLDVVVEHLNASVCVIGGGPAGMAAAMEAAQAGADVILIEQQSRLGGHLLYAETDESTEARRLPDQLAEQSRVRVLLRATAFGLYEGNLVAAFRTDRLLKLRARQVIVCTGARQRPFLFPNNDLPGIFLADGVLRLARLYGVRAGRRAVVLTDHDGGSQLAEQLGALGIEVAAVVDTRAGLDSGGKHDPWPTWHSSMVIAARGSRQLKKVQVARLDPAGRVEPHSEQEVACDLLCMASRPVPANELLLQGGMRFQSDGATWRPARSVAGLWAAGGAAGTVGLEAQVREGRTCGARAAAAVGCQLSEPAPELPETPVPTVREDQAPPRVSRRKTFVCFCEDVTVKDLGQAIAEGFDGIETLKRYTTVNMGPCQGKMCGQTAVEICARATGREIDAVGTTTSRPPVVPVELGTLAADRRHQPVRRTPLHHWHQEHGARWLDAGLWKRPESYGDPADEVRAVRSAVGLIDVSTLGKMEVVGPDAAELLDRVYLNRWADLKPGRARYAALCNEEGILFDDGVGARLGPDRFYLTATTGNADAVWQWLELWKATWRLNATIVNHTSGWSAMNLAGPRARDVLARRTQIDVSAAAFPYMALREGDVAGVPCRVLRIGFVGELGYEIHCPSALAWHLWEALREAGGECGLRPFGVEAQRILRLEKGHLIVGQDTDALSNPLDAGLEWLVRFDKPTFMGREPLLRLQARGSRMRLVGFELGAQVSAPATMEGCQVVEGKVTVGRVTSARHCPTLGKIHGLAWIPAGRAAVGQRFFVRWRGSDVPAIVAALPFYDPDGKRLKG